MNFTIYSNNQLSIHIFINKFMYNKGTDSVYDRLTGNYSLHGKITLQTYYNKDIFSYTGNLCGYRRDKSEEDNNIDSWVDYSFDCSEDYSEEDNNIDYLEDYADEIFFNWILDFYYDDLKKLLDCYIKNYSKYMQIEQFKKLETSDCFENLDFNIYLDTDDLKPCDDIANFKFTTMNSSELREFISQNWEDFDYKYFDNVFDIIDNVLISYCGENEDIEIPEGVTSISDESFYYCENLKNITIPNSVTSIGNNAFDNCENLTIHAPKGSYAETFAKENSIPFESF